MTAGRRLADAGSGVSSGRGGGSGGIAARIVLALLVVGAFATLITLGNWQLQRLAWKEALIAAATGRPSAPAVDAPGEALWPGFDIAAWDYRRVRLTGTFGGAEAYSWTVLGAPKGPRSGAGSYVIAPLTLADGSSVIVNRGFVPERQRDPAARPGSAPPPGQTTVEGLVRRDDPPNFVTPGPDQSKRLVFTRDIATLAAMFGLDPVRTAPYSVDLVASETPAGGLPQAGESLLTFSNNHLQYALTWYGLAAALAGVTVSALWRRREKPVERTSGR